MDKSIYIKKFKKLSLIKEEYNNPLETNVIDTQEKRIDSSKEFEEYFRIWFNLLGISKRPYAVTSRIVSDSEEVLNSLKIKKNLMEITNAVNVLKRNIDKPSIIYSLGRVTTREQYLEALRFMLEDLDLSGMSSETIMNIIRKIVDEVEIAVKNYRDILLKRK